MFLRTYPQSYKDTTRRCETLSARSYSSTTPRLHPTARICWSEAIAAHIASSVFNHLSTLMESVCFKPFLLIEQSAICPTEFKTISNLKGSDSSSWTIAELPAQSWLGVEREGVVKPSDEQTWQRSWTVLENWKLQQDIEEGKWKRGHQTKMLL